MYFLEDLKTYIEAELRKLKLNNPSSYNFPDILLDTIKVDYEPQDSDSYISILNVGEKIQSQFTCYQYSVNVRLVIKNINNFGNYNNFNYGIFSRWCTAIDFMLSRIENRKIENFNVVNIKQLQKNMQKIMNYSYVCEFVYLINVDQSSIPIFGVVLS